MIGECTRVRLVSCDGADGPNVGFSIAALVNPSGNESPIVSFLVPDVPKARSRLKEAGVIVSLGNGKPGRMRVSPSVFNNGADVDRMIAALS